MYETILENLKEKASDRDGTVGFSVEQMRTKFKHCGLACKKAVLTVKTKSGIMRYQDDMRLGKLFMQLYPILKSLHSCQSEQGLEGGINPPAVSEQDEEEQGEEGTVEPEKNKTPMPKGTKS